MPSPTRFDGVPVRDPALAALLTAAEHQGFRVEQAQNGNGHNPLTGLVVYAPDTAHPPIRFGVGRVSPRHTAHVRSQLRLAGLIDHDPATTPTTEEPEMARKQTGTRTTPAQDPLVGRTDLVQRALASSARIPINPGDKYEQGMKQAHAALREAGYPEEVIALAVMMQGTVLAWQQTREDVRRDDDREVLALAEEAERRATAAEAALAKAQEREAQARKDCGEALERARAAEARAESLDAALRPLRAILAGGDQ